MKLKKIDIDELMRITSSNTSKEFLEGIFLSEVSGRIFEATVRKNTVLIRYADNLSPKTKNIPFNYFCIQKNIGCYEDIINYGVEGI
jgi:hypothetical protein